MTSGFMGWGYGWVYGGTYIPLSPPKNGIALNGPQFYVGDGDLYITL